MGEVVGEDMGVLGGSRVRKGEWFALGLGCAHYSDYLIWGFQRSLGCSARIPKQTTGSAFLHFLKKI